MKTESLKSSVEKFLTKEDFHVRLKVSKGGDGEKDTIYINGEIEGKLINYKDGDVTAVARGARVARIIDSAIESCGYKQYKSRKGYGGSYVTNFAEIN